MAFGRRKKDQEPPATAGDATDDAQDTPVAEDAPAEPAAFPGDSMDEGPFDIEDFANAEGGQGYFQHRFDVYGREGKPCLGEGCIGVVKRVVQGGRSTFYCPSCQRR